MNSCAGPDLGFFLYKNLNASIPGIFRVLSVLRGRAGFPVKSRLLPLQSRHRAPLECCTAAHGTACERSRSAGRFSGDPFARRVRACRSPGLAAVAGPAESAAGRPAHVRPEACLLLKGCTVQAVCGVDESEALHKGPCLEQSRLRVLDGPESRRDGRLQGVSSQGAGVCLGGLHPRDGGVSARELGGQRRGGDGPQESVGHLGVDLQRRDPRRYV